MNFEFVVDDAIERALKAETPTVLCHIVNNSGGWGRGFVVPLGKKIPEAERQYRIWHRLGRIPNWNGFMTKFELGNTQILHSEENDNLWVANMVAQDGYEGIPVRYWAITNCMAQVLEFAAAECANIIMPRIGCGLGGGTWDKVEEAIAEALPRITVCDFG